MNLPTTILSDLSKVPPQAIDCEEAVLGTLLIYPEVMNDLLPILSDEMFYKDDHQVIYKNATQVFKKDNSVDIVTLTNQLRNSGELDKVGGPIYLSKISAAIYSESQVEKYALIVKEKYIRRQLIRYTAELQGKAFDEVTDLADIIDLAEGDLLNIADTKHKKEPVVIGKLVDGLIDKIQKIINKEIKLIGIPSGFSNLDRITGGFKDGEYIIIAGRPSMGKSALALQIAKNNAEMNIPVGLFSCEMSGESLALRTLSGVTDKTNTELMRGDCSIDDILKRSEELVKLPLFIDDSAGATVMEIRSKARKLIMKHGIKMIIIDYLQLLKSEGQSREQEVSSISRGVKAIALDLNIPVIALSQLNRKSEERSDKRPHLSDLRESGSLEQDADIVLFVHREANYGVKTVITDKGEVEANKVTELVIAKNRNGAIGNLFLRNNIALTNIYQEDEITEPSEEAQF